MLIDRIVALRTEYESRYAGGVEQVDLLAVVEDLGRVLGDDAPVVEPRTVQPTAVPCEDE